MGFYLDESEPTAPTTPVSGGFFLDEQPSYPEYKGPSLFSDPIGALTSADWWLTRPSGERITPQQAITTPLARAASGMTFGLGDEAIAGGASLIDAIRGKASLADAYDQRLAQVRGDEKSFQQASPVGDLVTSLAGGFKVPVPDIFAKTKGIAPAIGNIAKGSALGAGYGAAYGFGSGEGLDNRVAGAVDSAKMGALVGGGLQTASEGIQGFANFLGKLASESAPKIARRSIGARQSDYAKTANELNIIELPDGDLGTLAADSIDDLLKKGKLGESRDPSDLLKTAIQAEKEVSESVGDVIRNYDAIKTKPVFPEFEKARAYLEAGKVPADKIDNYATRLENLESAIKEKGLGRLSYLQQQKIAQGKLYDPHDSVLNGFNRAIYHDLQNSIEKVVPEVAPLNAELQKYKIVNPILRRSLAGDEAKDAMSKFVGAIRTSGGFGVPIISSMIALGPVPGAIIGTGISAAGKYAFSQPGQQNLANLLEKTVVPKSAAIAHGASGLTPRALLPSILAGHDEVQDKNQQSATSTVLKSSKPEPIKSPSLNPTPTLPPKQLKELSNLSNDKDIEKAVAKKVRSGKTEALAKEEAIQESGKDPLAPLIKSMVRQEAAGKADAVSHKGAVGLMQIMPSTAKQLARELGWDRYNLKNPTQNKIMGAYYIRKLIEEFGDIPLALTAYNQGPTRIRNILKRHDADSLDEIVHLLGPDGRKYAKQILSRLA